MKKNLGLLVILVMSTGVQAVSKQQIRLSIKENVVQAVDDFVKKNGIKGKVSDTRTAFEFAAEKGRTRVVSNLIQHYNVPAEQILQAAKLAAENGQLNTLELLWSKLPTESEKKSVFKVAVSAAIPNSQVIKMVMKDDKGAVTSDIVQAAQKNSSISATTLKALKKNSNQNVSKKKTKKKDKKKAKKKTKKKKSKK